MITQLKPLLTGRTLCISLALEGDLVRLTVIPKLNGEAEPTDRCLPFTAVDTAEALDAGLPEALNTYTATSATLDEAVAKVKKEADDAIALAKAKADAKKKPTTTFVKPKPATQKASGVEADEAAEAADELPGLPGLPGFDGAPAVTTAPVTGALL